MVGEYASWAVVGVASHEHILMRCGKGSMHCDDSKSACDWHVQVQCSISISGTIEHSGHRMPAPDWPSPRERSPSSQLPPGILIISVMQETRCTCALKTISKAWCLFRHLFWSWLPLLYVLRKTSQHTCTIYKLRLTSMSDQVFHKIANICMQEVMVWRC